MRGLTPSGSCLTASRASSKASSWRRCIRSVAMFEMDETRDILSVCCGASFEYEGAQYLSIRSFSVRWSMVELFSQSHKSSSSTLPFHGSSHSQMNARSSGSSYPSGCCKPRRAPRAASSLRVAMWPVAMSILASSSSPPDCASTFLASSIDFGQRPRIADSHIFARAFSWRTSDWSPSMDCFWKRINPSKSSWSAALSMYSRIQSPPASITAPSRRSSGSKSNRIWRRGERRAIDNSHVNRKTEFPTAMNIHVDNNLISSLNPWLSRLDVNGIKSPNSL